MGAEISRRRIDELFEKYNSRKKFFTAESEGLGPCCILLLSQVKIYDDVLNKIDRIRKGSLMEDDLRSVITELNEKISDCYKSETYDSEKIIIRTYQEIISEFEAVI